MGRLDNKKRLHKINKRNFSFRDIHKIIMSSSRNQPQKRKGLTLDLNAATTKKPKTASHILTSPDVQMLKLTSPELAEFLTRNPTLATPTPSGNTILFPKNVTEEQELYAKGFEVALKNMHCHQGTGSSGGGGATISTNTGLTISTSTTACSVQNRALQYQFFKCQCY